MTGDEFAVALAALHLRRDLDNGMTEKEAYLSYSLDQGTAQELTDTASDLVQNSEVLSARSERYDENMQAIGQAGDLRDYSTSDRRRSVTLTLILLSTWLVAGCGLLSLPSVPEDIVETVASEQVTIVDQTSYNNPTDEWVYTYLLLEVSGDEPELDTVRTTLSANGWKTRLPPDLDSDPFGETPDYSLSADRPEANLTLLELEIYLEGGRHQPTEKQFAEFPTRSEYTYFVAIIMPLDG